MQGHTCIQTRAHTQTYAPPTHSPHTHTHTHTHANTNTHTHAPPFFPHPYTPPTHPYTPSPPSTHTRTYIHIHTHTQAGVFLTTLLRKEPTQTCCTKSHQNLHFPQQGVQAAGAVNFDCRVGADRTIDCKIDHTIDRTIDRTTDRTTDRTIDRTIDCTIDHTNTCIICNQECSQQSERMGMRLVVCCHF